MKKEQKVAKQKVFVLERTQYIYRGAEKAVLASTIEEAACLLGGILGIEYSAWSAKIQLPEGSPHGRKNDKHVNATYSLRELPVVAAQKKI